MKARPYPLLFAWALIAGSLVAADNPRSGVPFATALADAHRLVAAKPSLSVMRVAGNSMLPYFGDGAVLVLKPAAAAALRPGMIVVYTNRFNETVAHRIIAADGDGWIVQGYNNDHADSTRVTDANLLGAVYATFRSAAPVATSADAAFMAAASATPLALAAPAR
jgi:signal peptidase I